MLCKKNSLIKYFKFLLMPKSFLSHKFTRYGGEVTKNRVVVSMINLEVELYFFS